MAHESALNRHIDGQLRTRALDRAIADLAERQHGVVARFQLRDLGLSRDAIDGRIERGWLHALFRSVYAVGHRVLSSDGRWMAAVLAGGASAVASHRDAAAIWGIRPSSRQRIDVTVPRKLHPRDNLDFHYSVLPPDEVTTERTIPVTTIARTIFDLAAVTNRREVERAMHEADRRRLYDALSLSDLLRRYPRRRGTKAINAILATQDTGPRTRNDFEEGFLSFIDRFNVPRPRMNEWLRISGHWIEADCIWHEQRVIVELD